MPLHTVEQAAARAERAQKKLAALGDAAAGAARRAARKALKRAQRKRRRLQRADARRAGTAQKDAGEGS